MGNLCSIFHSRFKHLMKVIPSARKAQLMDYLLLGWQTSLYKLKGSDKKWFMKPYSQIVEDTGIPKSTLERYIKEFTEAGFIERRQALYSRTQESGEFEVKKGTYIFITDTLLTLLKPAAIDSAPAAKAQDTHNEADVPPPESPINQEDNQPDCIDLANNEGTGSLKMRGLYISDLYSSSLNNTITFKKLTASVDKATALRLSQQFQTIQQFLTHDIKEEIPDEIKKLVLGTLFNLSFKHHQHFSSPKQFTAEYLYALINVDFFLPNIRCFKHRNNILAKMIRAHQWRTPKGFYKHFYLGGVFKDKQQLHEEHWQHLKEQEIKQGFNLSLEPQDPRLIALEAQMQKVSMQIDELSQRIYQETSEEIIVSIRETIQSLRRKLEQLWHQQALIEQQNEQNLGYDTKHCA